MARFSDRQDRERYMDSLERQMERQPQGIQRTLDQIEGSGRRTVLEKLRSSLPTIPGRTSICVREAGERETATEKPERAETQSSTGGPQEGAQKPRDPWWKRLLGG